MKESELKSYYRYWGKAEKDGPGYHLLPYHCLDVAAVAAAWWDESPTIRLSFRRRTGSSEEQIRAWVLFFVTLHDYGKFDVRFQLRVRPIWQTLYPNAGSYDSLPAVHDCRTYYHGERGLAWFMKDHGAMLGLESGESDIGLSFLDDPEDSSSNLWQNWKPWLEAVTGHHGYVRPSEYIDAASLPPTCDRHLAVVDQEARTVWLAALEQLFLKPVGLCINNSPPDCSSLMAGFCSVSDWLGSRCDADNFVYHNQTMELNEYFKAIREGDARRVLRFAGIIGHPRQYGSVGALLEHDDQPRSLQTIVDRLPLEPGLTIIEAPTGSGKTEAALAYAWRLINAGLADSIVFALPTQATANAMLGRLRRIAPLLFADHLNLLLAHGSARFNKEFTAIKHAALTGYEKEDGWVQCSEWLAESRKRVFLGQIGVCTVDQVLISVLPVKHRFVRGFGIGRSVLIVDEVHAYDAYMYGLLEGVLREQHEAGGSSLLLSATLPERQRQQLCNVWGAKLEKRGEETPYPLATWSGERTILPFVLDPSQLRQNNSVIVEPIRVPQIVPDENLIRRIVAAAEQGAQVAIVCNLVDVAQGLARHLRTMTALPVDLFHARYCFIHRREKELDAIARFGPKGDRAKGRIIVATQVIEQSLDLDFDWLITQLCPVDLLFQRMGRLHRHSHNGPFRPKGFEKPRCTVLLPDDDSYGLHGVIYANKRALWRTGQKLLSATDGEVVFPRAYRTWIEAVYQDKPWEDEPADITESYDKFRGEVEEVKKYLAQAMIERARGMNPFADTDEAITAVTRDGDMNRTVIPYCRTLQGRMLMDGTVLETLDERQSLEALSLNSVGVPKSWGYCFGAEEIDKEGRRWLEMEQDGEFYIGKIKDVTFSYHKDIGLEKKK